MSEAQLIFPESHLLDGFTTNVTSRQAGEPDPVVRELLQNCLDAAIREANQNRAEIHFAISRRPLSELPGLDEYVQAFQSATAGLNRPATHDVKSAISRIERALNNPEMSVLLCRDNGVGIDSNRMQALLSEGQSDKAAQGAGSFGLGHLTAYAASDLRYVLYAGRMNGSEIASGHCILASHKIGDTRFSSHGYWMTPSESFSLEHGGFPNVAPPLLRGELDKVRDSGAVIAIAGFNFFHEDDHATAIDHICEVAALNFLAAISEGKMVVHVVDERTGQSKSVDATSLESILRPVRSRLRARARGWLPGQQGYRALETLRSGITLSTDIDSSVRVVFRRLAPNSNDRSRVQIFRDGMWITNNEQEIQTGAFNGVRPFDAVVLLSDADPDVHTEFYDLVRNAEGPEHRGLTKRRELSRSNRTLLREMLLKIANLLKEEAGEIDADQGFSPPGFAVFDSAVVRAAAPVPRLRHRPVKPDTDDGERGTDPDGRDPDQPTSPDEPDDPGDRTRRKRRKKSPASGTAVKIRRAIVPQVDDDNSIRRLTAVVEVLDKSDIPAPLGFRVFVESGSDETCDQPLQPVWQRIRRVGIDGQSHDAKNDLEFEIPISSGTLDIELTDPVASTARFELDVVRRSTRVNS